MLLQDKFKNKTLILASASPRRKILMKELGLDFIVRVRNVKEEYPENLEKEHIAEYIAGLKASSFRGEIHADEIVIAADTIVYEGGQVLGKPADKLEAMATLESLSGKIHEVITGVCIMDAHKTESFSVITKVHFSHITQEEIEHYVDTCEPYDKAGAYGIQEWIGYIGIDRIEGSFYNVVGLPVKALYDRLKDF